VSADVTISMMISVLKDTLMIVGVGVLSINSIAICIIIGGVGVLFSHYRLAVNRSPVRPEHRR
jgi:hypothetical protein